MINLSDSETLRTVHTKRGIWRRRKLSTGKKVSTYELPTTRSILVTKKNGKIVRFNDYKLFATIFLAYKEGHNPDSGANVAKAAEVLRKIQNILILKYTTITTKELAQLVIAQLKTSDYNTSLRYASRYL